MSSRYATSGKTMMKLMRRLAKRASFWIFDFAQRFNIFVVPVHYYVPLSSTRELKASRVRWNHPIDLGPLNLDINKQRETLATWIAPYELEFRGNSTYLEGASNHAGPGFGYIEAQALHAFLRKTRPRRVIEVGSGVSTWCMLDALKTNDREGAVPFILTCIDPNPSTFLNSLNIAVKAAIVEEVELSFFDQLEANDLLSIDSSHAVRCCGDVARLYLEVLPRLKKGVFVHIHDVTFPYMFPRDVEKTYTQAMETALLFAMLANSPRYEVLFCLSLFHYTDPATLKATFPEYLAQPNEGGLPADGVSQFGDKRHFPSSTYLVVK